jgi:N-ethylmaleimide reductase
MSGAADLFGEVKLGALTLRNRLVMAPLTRNRADRDGVPSPLAAMYYAQRASAGLIVSEGTQPSAVAQGLPRTPGLHTEDQVTAWRVVTDAVHAAGGHIYCQLMHTGRVGHPDLVRHSSLPHGLLPMAPSAVPPVGMAKTYDGPKEFVPPRVMTQADIDTTITDFAAGARNAIRAGFDGVELHSASGVLPHQFLADGVNHRTDRYGGSIANRIRFVVELCEAVVDAIGGDRVGLRISPGHRFMGLTESDVDRLYPVLTRAVGRLGLGFLHIYETGNRPLTRTMRGLWPASYIVNPHPDGGRASGTYDDAVALLADGTADLVAYGRLFISNPDLPHRFRAGLPLTEPDPSTFYEGEHRGYVDYPAHTS